MPLLIKGTTLATSASVIVEQQPEANVANPVITVDQSFGMTYVSFDVGNHTIEVGLSNADRLSLVELLLGKRITESEARGLDGNR